MTRFLILLLLLLLCLPAVVLADPGGYYLGGQLALSAMDDVEAVGPNGPFNLLPDPGVAASLLIGYDFADSNPRLAKGRVELELTSRRNALDTVEFANGEFAADGDLVAQSALINFFYESRGMQPLLVYYGVGLGWAQVALEDAAVSGAELADDSDEVFAYQVGLGLGYQLTSNLTLDAGYRYFATQDPELKDSRGRDLSVEYQNHTILFGARYMF
ncbi:MAG: outer membrane beta-barrel protein [Desulfuromonadales bacterium]|nr:outer membrane beta-barrel protein [Desulfuromonadales bacterium]